MARKKAAGKTGKSKAVTQFAIKVSAVLAGMVEDIRERNGFPSAAVAVRWAIKQEAMRRASKESNGPLREDRGQQSILANWRLADADWANVEAVQASLGVKYAAEAIRHCIVAEFEHR
ncbi:MAG: hypothetical protein AB7I37_19540 [Pirellulales bacterium]